MFDLQLFLGVVADETFTYALSSTNPHLTSLLLSGGDYLSELSIDDKCYIGKPVPPFYSVDQLENLENHLLSLLNKLVPNYPLSLPSPILLTALR